jgi:hypothetical protein
MIFLPLDIRFMAQSRAPFGSLLSIPLVQLRATLTASGLPVLRGGSFAAQQWMGHRDIASTMVYLKGVRNSDIQVGINRGSLAAFA